MSDNNAEMGLPIEVGQQVPNVSFPVRIEQDGEIVWGSLNTTEELVTGTINATSQWQKVTSTALRGGFELMSNQQNLVFDALESFKKQAIEGKKRVATLFA